MRTALGYVVGACVLFAAMGLTECNAPGLELNCAYEDSDGNKLYYSCVLCQDPDANPCTADSWSAPAGAACDDQTRPYEPVGTTCDLGGGADGVCSAGTCSPSLTCESTAAAATQVCLSAVNNAWRNCYAVDDGPCDATSPQIVGALAELKASVLASCGDNDFGLLSADDLVGRLQTACASEATSLASRAFGGPHGAVWAATDVADRSCLLAAHESASVMVDEALGATGQCLASGSCDPAALATAIDSAATSAQLQIANDCAQLELLVATNPQQFVDRALHQSDCVVATTHTDTAPLDLSCGPSRVPSVPARGEYVQIILDDAEWGTKCGDGSSYAFQLRLPPEGEPLDRILIGMQGGGVCVFDDCNERWQNSPDLFEALNDQPPLSGVMSTDPAESQFANWTKVYLPYCTQDVFAGGGVAQDFTGFSVERYGALNVRASVEYVRNLLWQLQDQEAGPGYRPDQMVAAFGGWSAGGAGTLYNYHWVLDDLQWPQTTAFPDAFFALDSPDGIFSVSILGGILRGLWDSLAIFPPYCFEGSCAVGPNMYAATSPRLKAVPNQQMMIVTNQNDQTQVGTTYFTSTESWINVMRQSVCDTRDLPGIHYYLTNLTSGVHVVSLGGLYLQSVDGEVMDDWLYGGVVTAPDSVVDRIQEGDFVQDIPGVNPFPCTVVP
jgi:hypothetical protein